jgi:hypothetical protein
VRPYVGEKKKKKTSQKRTGEVAQDVGPEFKPQYHKKKKKKEFYTQYLIIINS